jgi:hypothetical protein
MSKKCPRITTRNRWNYSKLEQREGKDNRIIYRNCKPIQNEAEPMVKK